MKWNWGTGIFIFIFFFLALCVTFVIYTQHQDWSMVEDNYYPRQLRHEEKLVKMRNAAALVNPLKVTLAGESVSVRFPDEFRGLELSGTIHFYRPSDESKDLKVPVQPDTSLVVSTPVRMLHHGKYIVKVEWASQGRSYYKEEVLFVP